MRYSNTTPSTLAAHAPLIASVGVTSCPPAGSAASVQSPSRGIGTIGCAVTPGVGGGVVVCPRAKACLPGVSLRAVIVTTPLAGASWRCSSRIGCAFSPNSGNVAVTQSPGLYPIHTSFSGSVIGPNSRAFSMSYRTAVATCLVFWISG